jgi:trimethylamine--corrinoid protein Co-methyltransferase
MGQLLTSSYEQAVIDNEIFAAAFRIAAGIRITPESLSVDQIKNVGPGGQFLNQKFTQSTYRTEHWQPQLTTRMGWNEFQREKMGQDMRQRANDAARRLLKEHHPQPLDMNQSRELEQLAREMQKNAIPGS